MLKEVARGRTDGHRGKVSRLSGGESPDHPHTHNDGLVLCARSRLVSTHFTNTLSFFFPFFNLYSFKLFRLLGRDRLPFFPLKFYFIFTCLAVFLFFSNVIVLRSHLHMQ